MELSFSDAERDGAIYTLHKVLPTLLKLLAPITPYITDFLWQTLYSDKSIHTEQQAKEESNGGPDPAHSGHQRFQLEGLEREEGEGTSSSGLD